MGYRKTAINFLRKTQCAAGWDWNICLMPLGIYGEVLLHRHALGRIDHVEARQNHSPGRVDVEIITEFHAYQAGQIRYRIAFAGRTEAREVSVTAGTNQLADRFAVENPQLWWPAGQGAQPLYDLEAAVDDDVVRRRIGLRTLELVTEDDAVGQSMKFRVNGRDVFAKGANWIPADALPQRRTPQAVVPQLEAAVAANMNMLRLWGGGRFEPDWFYEACDALGLMIWHDFMFACMHYPSDRGFLREVEAEVTYQIRRLSHHASIALWCGDNEMIGALSWYEATIKDRDRYVANYDRLNRTLEYAVEDHDPSRRFWPSSPSLGPLNFHDGWHGDTRGDLHFWEVWHSAKPFEFYRTVRPRFCSEFGFQSFPSMKVIRSFVDKKDENLSSPPMEVHQRNKGGNARMAETMTRYFRFPSSFENLVYLSQVQQGLAMRTAIEFWRSLKPRCMGTLYWQLNDSWPRRLLVEHRIWRWLEAAALHGEALLRASPCRRHPARGGWSGADPNRCHQRPT
jgi:beta-mannosidase